jgi:hypothetical protein
MVSDLNFVMSLLESGISKYRVLKDYPDYRLSFGILRRLKVTHERAVNILATLVQEEGLAKCAPIPPKKSMTLAFLFPTWTVFIRFFSLAFFPERYRKFYQHTIRHL